MSLEIEGADALARLSHSLKRVENRKEVVNALRRKMRKPVPAVRRAVRASARALLPKRHGLNAWVARLSVTARFRLTGREASVELKGGRNSSGSRSDIRAIEKGRVRAPSWGHRGKNAWHTQEVTNGFFSKGATEGEALDLWRSAVIEAAEDVIKEIG